jgi:hypothetical protein
MSLPPGAYTKQERHAMNTAMHETVREWMGTENADYFLLSTAMNAAAAQALRWHRESVADRA